MKTIKLWFYIGLLDIMACNQTNVLRPNEQLLAVGTYTDTGSYGIYICAFDSITGSIRAVDSLRQSNPSYLCFSEDGANLYAVTETADSTAGLSSYRLNPQTNRYERLNAISGLPADPCHVAVNKEEAIVSAYTGGSSARYRLQADGAIGEELSRVAYDANSHIHSALYTDENLPLIADLGTDRIYVQGEPNRQDTICFEPGFGPRHFALDKKGEWLYVIGELSGKVAVVDWRGAHKYTVVQYIAADTTSQSPTKGSADIHLSADGRYLYASNRLQNDGIATFKVEADGLLTWLDYTTTGIHPRNFTLSANGCWALVASRDSNRVECFKRDPATGLLSSEPAFCFAFRHPVCLKLRR